jgi:hypothetical protein
VVLKEETSGNKRKQAGIEENKKGKKKVSFLFLGFGKKQIETQKLRYF